MKRIAVLGSGSGSNFQALLDAGFNIVLVISDREDAGILTRSDLPHAIAKTSKKICQLLQEAEIDLVCLAGYMRLVKEPLLSAFPNRIINIHPSLLPKYPGLEAWKQAVENGATESGCTVHYVDAGMDTGEIIKQAKVPVLPNDTPETLHARIQVAEHQLYPEVVAMLCEDGA